MRSPISKCPNEKKNSKLKAECRRIGYSVEMKTEQNERKKFLIYRYCIVRVSEKGPQSEGKKRHVTQTYTTGEDKP